MSGLLSSLAFLVVMTATTVGQALGTNATDQISSPSEQPVYTVFSDASWAVTHPTVSDMLGGHILPIYNNYIEGCTKAATEQYNTPHFCADDEITRLDMNTYQPKSVYNYTKMGYQKIKTPPELFKMIRDFYDANRGKDEIEWKTINPYHNMWESPPTIMLTNQEKWEGGGRILQNKIWDAAREVLQEWSGHKLNPVSLYGIRLYHNNSILAPHVDRFPLVTSAIINVDQDVDEPWPLEVYGHDGKATNVTMEPGDMVLYESHSVIHGRPFPLRGKFYANIFVHFEPIEPLDPDTTPNTYDPEADLPPYLIPGSKWAQTWRHSNPEGYTGKAQDARVAAQHENLEILKKVTKTDPSSFMTPDDLGWTPFHEAVRTGNLACVETILFAVGDNQSKLKNLMTYTGQSPLNIARTYFDEDQPVVKLLVQMGATDVGRNTNSDEL